MRTQRELYTENRVVFEYERDECLWCGQPLKTAYTSGWKTVQTMREVIMIAQQPKRCKNMECAGSASLLQSVRWRQIAPMWCTYGYDVITQIGWQAEAKPTANV